MNRKIIVIDDEQIILDDYRLILSPPSSKSDDLRKKAAALEASLFGNTDAGFSAVKKEYELTMALQGEDAFHLVKEARDNGVPFAVAFIDVRMPPGWDGVHTAKKIRQLDPDIEIVIVTAYSDRNRSDIIAEVGKPERLLYIKKPFDPDEIRQLALSLTRKWNLERRTEKHTYYLRSLLDSVRRLKTLDVSSIHAVLSAILNELLQLIDARKGVVASKTAEKITLQAVSEGYSREQATAIIDLTRDRLAGIFEVSMEGDVLVFPLKSVFGHFFILVSDVQWPMPNEHYNLLRLFLETASEVLNNAHTQEQILRNERIAAIGELSAGIIHEVANPLTLIISSLEIFDLGEAKLWELVEEFQALMSDPQLSEVAKMQIEQLIQKFRPQQVRRSIARNKMIIRNGTERIQVLMDNIRSLSGGTEVVDLALNDVSTAIEDTLVLASNMLKKGMIKVNKEWTPPLLALCDPNSLKQVFLNIILNAVQAMVGAGTLWIDGKKVRDKILLSFRDSGPGIDKVQLDRMFDAFYTTKKNGTGLGLSIVKSVVEKHHGRIEVMSNPGRGTTFYVSLPTE